MSLEIRIALTPKQREFDEAADKYPVVFYGGSRGSGKSYALRNIILKRRFKHAGSVGYIFRKNFAELEANHIAPLFNQFPALREYYNEGKKTLRLPNASELRFAYCDHYADLSKFQGREIHDLGIEEAGDWPEQFYEILRASNRSSRKGTPARTLLTGNPGGAGHVWLRRLFIDRDYRDGETPTDYHFVKATVKDNPALTKVDPDYVKRLASLKSETLRRAWLEGDWDLQAGQFFSELRRDVHFIKPFPIPIHWKWFGGYDYGFNHPAGWQWWVQDEDGNCYCVKEINRARMSLPEQAELVAQYEKHQVELQQKPSTATVFEAGHDCWAKKKASDPTIFEDLMREFSRLKVSCVLRQANINRKLGASNMRERIRVIDGPRGKTSRLFIFNTCPMTWDCLTRMVHDPDNVEDVLKVDSIEGDPLTGDEMYDCFVPGTPVMTASGERPIETIKLGDLVLTRYGLRPVLAAWKTHENAKTMTIALSNGRSIRGTPNHPVWVNDKGFTRLDGLRLGDMLLPWQSLKPSFLTGLNSAATQNQNTLPTEAIFLREGTTGSAALARCIKRFGARVLAQFRLITRSTTKTGTRLITRLKTLSVLPRAPIWRRTWPTLRKTQKDWPECDPILSALGRWLASGTNQPMAAPGIVSTQNNSGSTASQMSTLANNAERFMKPNTVDRLNIATTIAGKGRSRRAEESCVGPFSQNPVSDAGQHINQRKTAHAFVPISVIGITSAQPSETFTLSVEEHHEYFAGGVLVKNCSRYALSSRPLLAKTPTKPTIDRYKKRGGTDNSWTVA